MALGNGNAPNGGVTSEKALMVNGTNTTTTEAGSKMAKQVDSNTAFLRAARGGHLAKVLEYLDSGAVIDINISNSIGLNALHLAAKDGHVELARELLARGAVVDAATKKGNTALHISCLAGQEEIVRLLIQYNAAINVQSQNGFTPLYMAAQENHDGVVKYLLSKGASQTLATEDGFTPLAVAMQQGHDKVVSVLLENDARGKVRLPALHIAAKKDDVKAAALLLQNEHNPDVTSKSGFTPLHIAAHYGNDKIASLLYDKGADVNYAAKHNITPLHVASKWGKINMVTLLVAKGADIQAKTRDGLTPLHCAGRSGHDQVVDMLLENGAPIYAKTKNGLAPLHMAAQGEHVDAARILLYHGAAVDEVTVDYLTALHVAAHCGHIRVAKLLLDRGADPNARALNGFTPLHIACKKNRIKMVELLLKHNASIGATTESGLTPLHVASFMGCMNIVIYLLQHDANPDIATVRGESPLHLAARANQTDIIRILLRNGAVVDAKAREDQTPLHVAARLGNVDIVMLLLQHGASALATTKDLYTPLHIAAKEGQEEVTAVLLENGGADSLTATTKKGFTPLHLAAKYGHMNVARVLLQRDNCCPVDAQGKNGVTPLHVATHYDHQPVALLLLDKGASPHAVARNGHTPLHIAARKNQMEIATTLLEYGAAPNAESKAGFMPLHLAAQEGHTEMCALLLEHGADATKPSRNGLQALHLCAQEDRDAVAHLLLSAGANPDDRTRSGYSPMHVACHNGHVTMVKLLLEYGANVNSVTAIGYTPLHQAAQQGHVLVINLLLKNKADPNMIAKNGQTALGIANKLGYISIVEELKIVTETNIITTTSVNIEEKYKVVAPEAMHETLMSDSEDEGDDPILGDQQQYKYMTVDDMKSYGDDSMKLDVTNDEYNRQSFAPLHNSSQLTLAKENYMNNMYAMVDNIDIDRQPVTMGFLVSFLVDARGGAMRGCRHSGVRVIVPPRCAPSPMRITCRYVRPQRTPHQPPLMESEALASRILELGPVGAKFLGPVIIEIPHFASLRGNQREIIVLRSDNGETWKEHTLEATQEAIQDVLNHSFSGEELTQIEDLHTSRITRILTTDFPHYIAVVSRFKQEVHIVGPDGGTLSSTAVPLVQAVFPPNALTKKIRVGLQAQAIDTEIVAKLLGNSVAISPIVTIEPRRRKFHKAITLSVPAPKAHTQGMINKYSGSAPTLRLLCSITGGQHKAIWEDVTGSTPLTFVRDCVQFTTTVSARFWLVDSNNVSEAAKMATELYTYASFVPFMVKFVVFCKRISQLEARVRVFCMTDDKEDKTLEQQEHFTEIAKSRDVEVLGGRHVYMQFAGNLIPVLQSTEQPHLGVYAFKENRLAFTMRIRDVDEEAAGRIIFMGDSKVAKGEPNQVPLCTLKLVLPTEILPYRDSQSDLLSSESERLPNERMQSGAMKNGTDASSLDCVKMTTTEPAVNYDGNIKSESYFETISNEFPSSCENTQTYRDEKLFDSEYSKSIHSPIEIDEDIKDLQSSHIAVDAGNVLEDQHAKQPTESECVKDATVAIDADQQSSILYHDDVQVLTPTSNIPTTSDPEQLNKSTAPQNNSQQLVDDVIQEAEDIVKDLQKGTIPKEHVKSLPIDALHSLESDTHEAFKFLENEASSPIESYDISSSLLHVCKDTHERTDEQHSSDTAPFAQSDLLSKIPVHTRKGGGKVKTIKKHANNPLKEFVKLAQDVNWEDDSESTNLDRVVVQDSEMNTATISVDPIVKTTVANITTEGIIVDRNPSKIPVFASETLFAASQTEEDFSTSNTAVNTNTQLQSKIPTYNKSSDGVRTKSPGCVQKAAPMKHLPQLESDSEEEACISPHSKSVSKMKTAFKAFESSSGSDVALHEAGTELSESDLDDVYQQEPCSYFDGNILKDINPDTINRQTYDSHSDVTKSEMDQSTTKNIVRDTTDNERSQQ